MESTKPAWKSKTVWASLIMLIALGLGHLGIDFGADDQSQTVDAIYQIIEAVCAVVAIYGRITAKKAIGGSGGASYMILFMLLLFLSLSLLPLAGCTPIIAMDSGLQSRVYESYNDSMEAVSSCETGHMQIADACVELAQQQEAMTMLYQNAELRPAIKADILGCLDITGGYIQHCENGSLTVEDACRGIALNARAFKAVLDGGKVNDE